MDEQVRKLVIPNNPTLTSQVEDIIGKIPDTENIAYVGIKADGERARLAAFINWGDGLSFTGYVSSTWKGDQWEAGAVLVKTFGRRK